MKLSDAQQRKLRYIEQYGPVCIFNFDGREFPPLVRLLHYGLVISHLDEVSITPAGRAALEGADD